MDKKKVFRILQIILIFLVTCSVMYFLNVKSYIIVMCIIIVGLALITVLRKLIEKEDLKQKENERLQRIANKQKLKEENPFYQAEMFYNLCLEANVKDAESEINIARIKNIAANNEIDCDENKLPELYEKGKWIYEKKKNQENIKHLSGIEQKLEKESRRYIECRTSREKCIEIAKWQNIDEAYKNKLSVNMPEDELLEKLSPKLVGFDVTETCAVRIKIYIPSVKDLTIYGSAPATVDGSVRVILLANGQKAGEAYFSLDYYGASRGQNIETICLEPNIVAEEYEVKFEPYHLWALEI